MMKQKVMSGKEYLYEPVAKRHHMVRGTLALCSRYTRAVAGQRLDWGHSPVEWGEWGEWE